MELSTERPVAVNRGVFAGEDEALHAVVDRLVEALDPGAVWLFGSRARGTAGSDSDFDLMVVGRPGGSGWDDDYVAVLRPLRDLGVGCDVVPISAADFAEAAELHTTLVAEVLRHGRKLYEAPTGGRVPVDRDGRVGSREAAVA